jgi:hypothetical protein
MHLKCDETWAETSFRLSAKRKSPFKSAGASVQSITGSRVVRISVSNVGYTTFRGSVKSTGYPLHSPVSPSPHRVPSHFNWTLQHCKKEQNNKSWSRNISDEIPSFFKLLRLYGVSDRRMNEYGSLVEWY